MTDLPPGEWSELLVGHQWPSSTSVMVLNTAAQQRETSEGLLDSYSSDISGIRLNHLAVQEGFAAETIRDLFLRGEQSSRELAHKNLRKRDAYAKAKQSVESLRNALAGLAVAGNAAISEVQHSQRPVGVKVSEIVSIVSDLNTQADVKAALCAADLYSSIQSILDAEGFDKSARVFGESRGIEVSPFVDAARLDVLMERVAIKLEKLNHGTEAAQNGSTVETHTTLDSIASGNHHDNKPITLDSTAQPSAPSGNYENGPSGISATGSGFRPADGTRSQAIDTPLQTVASASAAQPAAEVGSLPSLGAQTTTAGFDSNLPSSETQLSNGVGPVPSPASSSPSAVPANQIDMTNSPSKSETTTLQEIPNISHATVAAPPITNEASASATSIDSGSLASPTAETISSPATTSGHSPLASGLSSHLTETIAHPTTTFEAAHAVAPSTEVTPVTATETAQPVIAAAPAPSFAPNLASSPTFAPTPPVAPQGPLIAYGADLKPPATTAVSNVPMTPAAPTSAPVNPASGTAPTGQAPVVRQQQAAAAAAKTSAAGLTERAFAATAAGAAAGAVTSRAAAESRLRRLLEAVARQQPRLRWAIGDLDDGTTVLVTDLCNGWVPPHIDIPTGVQLLPPGTRRNDLTGLLGSATVSVSYQPGQYLPAAEQPPLMSIRARDTPLVDDLGWELAQATKWRDGLPRLAHTLARAASSKTGCLDSELELLHGHLDSIECSILNSYPDAFDAERMGNWQLLATIDALVNGQTTAANYHFSWFRARTLARGAHR